MPLPEPLATLSIVEPINAVGVFIRARAVQPRHLQHQASARFAARIGKAKAVTATARKIAVLFYNALRYGMEYIDPGALAYETRYRERSSTTYNGASRPSALPSNPWSRHLTMPFLRNSDDGHRQVHPPPS